jgi:hypothetical protein
MIDNYPAVIHQSFVVFPSLRTPVAIPLTPLSYALQVQKFEEIGTEFTLTNEQIDIVKSLLNANANVDEPTRHQACLPLFMACLLGDASLVDQIASHTLYINQPSLVITNSLQLLLLLHMLQPNYNWSLIGTIM